MDPLTHDETLAREAETWLSDLAAAQGRFDHLPLLRDEGVRRRLSDMRWRLAGQEVVADIRLLRNPGFGRGGNFDRAYARGRLIEFRAGLHHDGSVAKLAALSREIELAEAEQRGRVHQTDREWSSWATELSKGFAHLAQVTPDADPPVAPRRLRERAVEFVEAYGRLGQRAAFLAFSHVCADGSCIPSHAAIEELGRLFGMVRDALPAPTFEEWVSDVDCFVRERRQVLVIAQSDAFALSDEAERVAALADHLAQVRGEDRDETLIRLVAATPGVRRAGNHAREVLDHAMCARGRCHAAHTPREWEPTTDVGRLVDVSTFRGLLAEVKRRVDLWTARDHEIVRGVGAIRVEVDDLLVTRRHPPFGGETPRVAESDTITLQHFSDQLEGLLGDAAQLGEPDLCQTGRCSRAHAAVQTMGHLLKAFADPASDDWSAGVAAVRAGREVHRVGVMEREALAQVSLGLNAVADKIREGLAIAGSLPLTRPDGAIGQEDRAALGALLERVVEWVETGRALSGPSEHAHCREGTCQQLHASAVELAGFLEGPGVEHLSAVALLMGRVAEQSAVERDEVEIALGWARDLMPSLDRAWHLSQHLNIDRSGGGAAVLMVRGAVERLGPALTLAESAPAHECDGHVRCRAIHDAARDLTHLRRGGAESSWRSAATLLEDEFETDLRETEDLLALASEIPARVRQFARRVASAEETVARLVDAHSRGADVWLGSSEVRVTAMSDMEVALASLQHLDAVKPWRDVIDKSRTLVEHGSLVQRPHASAAAALFEIGSCDERHAEVRHLARDLPAVAGALDSAEAQFSRDDVVPTLEQLNASSLSSRMPPLTTSIDILDLQDVHDAAKAIAGAEERVDASQSEARAAARAVHTQDVLQRLSDMGLDVLRKAADFPIRAKVLEAYGLTDVASILELGDTSSLSRLDGLGFDSAWTIHQAALRLEVAEREDTPLRIDVRTRTADTQRLLESLAAWDVARACRPDPDVAELAEVVLRSGATGHALVTVEGAGAGDHTPSVAATLMAASPSADVAHASTGDVWDDFLRRPADFFGLIAELGFVTEDEQKMHGDLPEEVVAAVRDVVLRRDHLTARLRAYQAFGARYALAQRKVVIGDEMGLGKTVEALAVLAHRRAAGATHFIVVCPAAVVSNWMTETRAHTSLIARRLHGPAEARRSAIREWTRSGGVAVTTFDLLGHLGDALADVDLDTVVIDEAHYIKNPQALRSVRAATLVDQARYAVLMTGTPMENHPDEFRSLVDYVQPDVAAEAPTYHPAAFRKHLAPVYLRRNQEDVLTELPEVVEVDEWLPCELSASAAYRAAVSSGDFAAMRQAGMADDGAKMHRLAELVEEAVANRRKVIVFSYFRDVLTRAARHLEASCPVFGPMTGSTPAGGRQDIVDAFTSSDGGGVLVAQIVAGGVGLNIQAASVVVICEPQLKPTLEDQAVARAHRMGQTQTVQVHRLLDEDGIDRRVRQILAEKRELFDEYARRSAIVEGSPDAVDVSDTEIARQVVAEERKRLHLLDRR